MRIFIDPLFGPRFERDPLTEDEKLDIIRNCMNIYLQSVGLNPGDITISDNKIRLLIRDNPTHGIRILKNKLKEIFRHIRENETLPHKLKTSDIVQIHSEAV